MWLVVDGYSNPPLCVALEGTQGGVVRLRNRLPIHLQDSGQGLAQATFGTLSTISYSSKIRMCKSIHAHKKIVFYGFRFVKDGSDGKYLQILRAPG